MLINEDDYVSITAPENVQDRIKASQEILNKWSMISQLIKQSGWRVLCEYIDKEFETHNSVYNARSEELEFKRGYCTGLKYPAQTIDIMKRKAVEAQKYLDSIAKQESKNE